MTIHLLESVGLSKDGEDGVMLRSVDVKQIIVQSNSMERVQQTQQQHPEMQQRYLDIQLSEEKKLGKENVHNSEESEQARLRKRDDREESGQQSGQQDPQKKGAAGQEEDPEGDRAGRIDIRV
jgi:hypothetical protein